MNQKRKIIIIGAGPGGLTAGMLLASRGFQVKIFEKDEQVGGRNQEIRLGDFRFDTGPTFLMMSFILKEMFEEAGEKMEDHLKFINLEPMYHLAFSDLEMDVSSDAAKMKAEIKRLFPGEEESLQKFMRKEKIRFEKLFPCLQKDYVRFGTFFSKDFLRAIPILGVGKSLFQNLGNYFNSEKLKLSFTFQSKYLGMSPWECPAGFTIIPYIERAFGIFHVIGGLNKISQAMADVFLKKGGQLELSSRVDKLILENGKAKGVFLQNGNREMADEVIINADFAHSMTSLFPEGTLKKYSPKNLKKKKYSCSTFMLYLGVRKKYPLPHHNIYFADEYRKNIADIFEKKELSEDMSFYLQNASVTDPTLAPEGKSAVYILVPVANNFSGIDWPAIQEEYKNKILDTVQKRIGILKDLRENIEQEKVITPRDWEDSYNVFRGATFNLAHNLGQMLYFRPRNKFEEVENCYLVGGGTHPGSGLPTIYESARITANLISQKFGLKIKKPSQLEDKELLS